MTIKISDVRFDSRTGKLARNVAASERLSAMLPQDEVAELLAGYEASTETLTAAKKIIPALPDVFTMLDPTFRKGKAADPAKLISELAAAQAERDQAARTVEVLATIPERYIDKLEQLITSSVDGFTEGLDAHLQELLDEAETVLAAMGPGVTDAQSSIDAGKVAEWTRWRELHAAYQALRRDHMEVLRASTSSPSNFAPQAAATGHAFFLNLDEAVPNYARVMDSGPTPTLDGKILAQFPLPIHDFADPAHFLAVVDHRGRLQPVVEHADEALARSARAVERAQAEAGGQPAPVGRERLDWGSTGWQSAAMFGTPRPKHHAR
jgi:hypothetical protein